MTNLQSTHGHYDGTGVRKSLHALMITSNRLSEKKGRLSFLQRLAVGSDAGVVVVTLTRRRPAEY
jgi:hypothetical protein